MNFFRNPSQSTFPYENDAALPPGLVVRNLDTFRFVIHLGLVTQQFYITCVLNSFIFKLSLTTSEQVS